MDDPSCKPGAKAAESRVIIDRNRQSEPDRSSKIEKKERERSTQKHTIKRERG